MTYHPGGALLMLARETVTKSRKMSDRSSKLTREFLRRADTGHIFSSRRPHQVHALRRFRWDGTQSQCHQPLGRATVLRGRVSD